MCDEGSPELAGTNLRDVSATIAARQGYCSGLGVDARVGHSRTLRDA